MVALGAEIRCMKATPRAMIPAIFAKDRPAKWPDNRRQLKRRSWRTSYGKDAGRMVMAQPAGW
jgi:hypothetical protein